MTRNFSLVEPIITSRASMPPAMPANKTKMLAAAFHHGLDGNLQGVGDRFHANRHLGRHARPQTSRANRARQSWWHTL